MQGHRELSLIYWADIIKKTVEGYLLTEVESGCMCSFTQFWLLILVKDKESVLLGSVTTQEKYTDFHTDLQICTSGVLHILIQQRRDENQGLCWYLVTRTEEEETRN